MVLPALRCHTAICASVWQASRGRVVVLSEIPARKMLQSALQELPASQAMMASVTLAFVLSEEEGVGVNLVSSYYVVIMHYTIHITAVHVTVVDSTV